MAYPGPFIRAARPAPYTFPTKRDAEVWLTLQEAEIRRGEWLDPQAGTPLFADYAASWLDQRELSPKTAQLYELLLRLHLNPTFGQMRIGAIRQEHVRFWRAARLKAGPASEPPFGPVTVAKAYRLRRAILNTALHDKRIRENLARSKALTRRRAPSGRCLAFPRSTPWPRRSARATER